MAVIHKYALAIEGGEQRIQVPSGLRILGVQEQRGSPMVWAVVDQAAPLVMRRFILVGTGHPLEDAERSGTSRYIGTVQLLDGALVLHAFDRGEA